MGEKARLEKEIGRLRQEIAPLKRDLLLVRGRLDRTEDERDRLRQDCHSLVNDLDKDAAELFRVNAWNDQLLAREKEREAMARNALRALGANQSRKVDVFKAREILRGYLDGRA